MVTQTELKYPFTCPKLKDSASRTLKVLLWVFGSSSFVVTSCVLLGPALCFGQLMRASFSDL